MLDLAADSKLVHRYELDVVAVVDRVAGSRFDPAVRVFHRVRAEAGGDANDAAVVQKLGERADRERSVTEITTALGKESVARGDGASAGLVPPLLGVGGVKPALVFFVPDAEGQAVHITADASNFDHSGAGSHVAFVAALTHRGADRVERRLRSAATGIAGN